MSSRTRRFFDDDEDDDENNTPGDQPKGWSRSRRTNGTIVRDRRNGVSRDPLSEVRAIVEDDWKETLDENFHPITLALDMLDTSSLGRARDLEHFKNTNQQIEQALQSTVNEHFQGFNASVGTYGQMTGSVTESSKQVRSARDALLRAKVQLSSKRMDLLDMSAKSSQYQGMIKLLRQVAELQKLPEELEAQLSSKHFLQAVETLGNAAALANREEMLEIPALNDLRQYLKSQAVSLVEILVEELHNHLYLKSPYCDSRWVSYVSGQSDLPVIDLNSVRDPGEKKTRKHSTVGRLELEQHQIRQDTETSRLPTSDTKHPELDSLHYIVIITQSLFSMGKLPYALETMDQRVPVEIAQVISRTKTEILARHRGIQTLLSIDPISMSHEAQDSASEPLKDLLWTLFSKWDAILQAHRALYDAVSLLQDRRGSDSKSPSHTGAYDFHIVWQPLELELSSILDEFLILNNDQAHRTDESRAWNPLFNERSRIGGPGSLFKIKKAHSLKDHAFANEEYELREMLQNSVPGLLSEKSDHTNAEDATSNGLSASRHLLAARTPFNIIAVLQPTMAFLKRAKRIVPFASDDHSNQLSTFLDGFLESKYYSQLTESVDLLYREVINQEKRGKDSSVSSENHHYLRDANGMLSLVKRLSALLSGIPYRRAMFAETILSIVANFYQQCVAWLTRLTANDNPDAHLGALKLGSAWANKQQIRDLWLTYDISAANELSSYEALATETETIFSMKKDFVIKPEDLLQDPSSFRSLMDLYEAVIHFEKEVSKLGSGTGSGTETKTPSPIEFSDEARATFDRLLSSWRTLGRSILVVIRLELRAHVLFYLQTILGQGNYNIEEEANEVDSFVVDLNSDLSSICALLGKTSSDEYRFVMTGLATLIADVLIEDCSSISIMTKQGAEKLALDISALQQNLRNLVSDPADADLSRAVKFYSHFQIGPRGLSDLAADTSFNFTHEQSAKLMTLMYSVELASEALQRAGNRDSISAKRKQLNQHLEKLSTQMLSVA